MSRYRAANDGVDRGVVMGGRGTHNWSLSWVGATLLATASIITVGGPVSSATATTTSSTVTVGIVPLENAAAVSEVTLLSGLVRTSASSPPAPMKPSSIDTTSRLSPIVDSRAAASKRVRSTRSINVASTSPPTARPPT